METQEELVSFLDLLNLDEEVVDNPLKYLMAKSNHSNKHLKSAIQLLQYKNLINTQEGTECENDEEFEFVVKLLKEMTGNNVDYVCKIINIVLCLNISNIVSKAEHLLQQILFNIEFQSETSTSSSSDNDTCMRTLPYLKASDSILDAVMKKGEKVSLLFLETPLEKILDSTDETLKIYFLTNTVPKFLDGVIGYNILDRIWNHIQYLKGDRRENALRVLSCLSDYYLPIPDAKGDSKFISEIIYQYNFWDIILFGITSDDTAIRKISVYLSKRGIDCVRTTKRDIIVKSNVHTIFQWQNNNSKSLKCMWDNFFVLIDSLEEKQSNIVLPSLKLFETIHIGDSWLNSAFSLGLKHDNTQVRLKCIEYKLKTKIRNQSEACLLLEALNDINIYDQSPNDELLHTKMRELLKDTQSFKEIFKTIPLIKWSSVPLYHISNILSNLNINVSKAFDNDAITKIITDIVKVPCNNVILREAVLINITYFVKHCCKDLDWIDIAYIYLIIHLDTEVKESILNSMVQHVYIRDEDKQNYFEIMMEHFSKIDLIMIYLHTHKEDIDIFIDVIHKKICKLNEGINRQYSDKKQYLNDVIFLLHFSSKTRDKRSILHSLDELIARQYKTVIQYLLSLFSSEVNLTLEDATALYEMHDVEFIEKDLGGVLLQLYKTSILFLKDNPELDKAVLSICTFKMLLKNPVLISRYKHEMLKLNRFIEIVSNIEFRDTQNESVGRLKNVFYEKSCEIIYLLIKNDKDVESCIKEVINFIENVLECGGYGCLKWILKIVNKIVEPLTDNETNFNMTQFINRVWNEIEELKSNNQYSPCIEEFVELITQDALLEKSMYNNIVISYCNKIIEYGPVKTNPLYYLIRNLNRKDFKKYGHLIYVLCEILLYCPVPRKDQR